MTGISLAVVPADNDNMGGLLKSDDRVLVLGLGQCSAAKLREWAATLTEGFLVGIGEQPDVQRVRRELADVENVMFTPGSRDEIPWMEFFFTAILDAEGGEATGEMRRVLRAEGRIYSIQP